MREEYGRYHWYPGHMTKAVRMMQENIKLIDLVIELVDARIPYSSQNPDIDRLAAGKSRILLLNKADLASAEANAQWAAFFREKGIHVQEINAKTGEGIKAIDALVREACREKLERDKKRGIVNRPVRAMVAGIPNVGKSTFINAFAGKACTKTGNKPGVTKGKQWIRLNKSLELLDTPGILWPRFEDAKAGMYLALVGSMNDETLLLEELACDLLDCIQELYPGAVSERYGVLPAAEAQETLGLIAKARGCLGKGDTLDDRKAAAILLEDFRSGRLGRMTLERPRERE